MAGRHFERLHGGRLVAGLTRIVHGPVALAHRGRLAEVECQIVEPLVVTVTLFQRQPHVTVQPPPPAGGHVLVDAGADELVREVVPVRAARHRADQPGPFGGFERLDHHRHPAVDHGRQQPHVEPLADHGRGLQHVVGDRGKPGQPLQDDLPDSFRDAEFGPDPGQRVAAAFTLQDPGLDKVEEHFLDAERMATGLGVQVARELGLVRAQLTIRRRRHHLRHAALVQTRQRQPLPAAAAAQVRKQLGQQMGPPDVGVPVRARHEQPHRLV